MNEESLLQLIGSSAGSPLGELLGIAGLGAAGQVTAHREPAMPAGQPFRTRQQRRRGSERHRDLVVREMVASVVTGIADVAGNCPCR